MEKKRKQTCCPPVAVASYRCIKSAIFHPRPFTFPRHIFTLQPRTVCSDNVVHVHGGGMPGATEVNCALAVIKFGLQLSPAGNVARRGRLIVEQVVKLRREALRPGNLVTRKDEEALRVAAPVAGAPGRGLVPQHLVASEANDGVRGARRRQLVQLCLEQLVHLPHALVCVIEPDFARGVGQVDMVHVAVVVPTVQDDGIVAAKVPRHVELQSVVRGWRRMRWGMPKKGG